MIQGLWRNTHFLLAISVSLFLVVASITGTLLGIEAIVDQTKQQSISNLEKFSLKKTMDAFQDYFIEVYEFSVTEKNYVIVQGLTNDGFETVYVNPKTGEKIAKVETENPFFNTVRNLHRSLFLKKTGRIIMGFISFLTVLLVLTGFLLFLKRIGGFSKLIRPISEKHFFRKGHLELGRWFFLPILLVSLSGVYLVTERLAIFSEDQSKRYTYKAGERYVDLNKFTLDQIKKVEYPFSSLKDDTYKIEFYNRTLTFQQGDNSLLVEEIHSIPFLIRAWAYWIHTGENNILLAILLSLTALALLFFIVSGLSISSKTSWTLFKFSKNNLNDAKIIILYGSETGKSYQQAKKLIKSLKKRKDNIAICSLNNYRIFPEVEKFIVLTSTYGDGESPSNANLFKTLFKKHKQVNAIDYAVLGFGSKDYPKFCRFAEVVDTLFYQEKGFTELYPLFKINEQNIDKYLSWENKLLSRI